MPDAVNEDFASEWLERTRELVDLYRPSLVWFDWTVSHPVFVPYFNRFMAYYYNCATDWKRQVVVNTKQGYPTDIQVWDVERGKSDKLMKHPWQTDTFIGPGWSCIAQGNCEPFHRVKTSRHIIHELVDIVSKNGNMLLDVAPLPDGTISEEQRDVLLSIGRWLKVNGEAIYGARCWKRFGEGDAVPAKGSFTDDTATAYTSADIRFTIKGCIFYAIVLNWDEEGTTVKSLDKATLTDAKIKKVEMLGSKEKIAWKTTDHGLRLEFPNARPCEAAYTFKITFDKPVGEHLPSEASEEALKHGY
jgi:alpha-L-fucosidase